MLSCFAGLCNSPSPEEDLSGLTRPELKKLYEKSLLANGGKLIVRGIFARANTKNNNKRVYPKYILKREVAKFEVEHILKGTALGELDHPNYASRYFKCLNLPNISHQVLSVQWKGDLLWGTIEILPTPSGLLLWELYSQGIKLGVSSRGWASLRTDAKAKCVFVDDDFELITFDFVTEPSTTGAYLVPLPKAYKHWIPNQMKCVQTAFLGHGVTHMKNFSRVPNVSDLIKRIRELQEEAVSYIQPPNGQLLNLDFGSPLPPGCPPLPPTPSLQATLCGKGRGLDHLLLHSHYIVLPGAPYLVREEHARDFQAHVALFATRAHLADQEQYASHRGDFNTAMLQEVVKQQVQRAVNTNTWEGRPNPPHNHLSSAVAVAAGVPAPPGRPLEQPPMQGLVQPNSGKLPLQVQSPRSAAAAASAAEAGAATAAKAAEAAAKRAGPFAVVHGKDVLTVTLQNGKSAITGRKPVKPVPGAPWPTGTPIASTASTTNQQALHALQAQQAQHAQQLHAQQHAYCLQQQQQQLAQMQAQQAQQERQEQEQQAELEEQIQAHSRPRQAHTKAPPSTHHTSHTSYTSHAPQHYQHQHQNQQQQYQYQQQSAPLLPANRGVLSHPGYTPSTTSTQPPTHISHTPQHPSHPPHTTPSAPLQQPPPALTTHAPTRSPQPTHAHSSSQLKDDHQPRDHPPSQSRGPPPALLHSCSILPKNTPTSTTSTHSSRASASHSSPLHPTHAPLDYSHPLSHPPASSHSSSTASNTTHAPTTASLLATQAPHHQHTHHTHAPAADGAAYVGSLNSTDSCPVAHTAAHTTANTAAASVAQQNTVGLQRRCRPSVSQPLPCAPPEHSTHSAHSTHSTHSVHTHTHAHTDVPLQLREQPDPSVFSRVSAPLAAPPAHEQDDIQGAPNAHLPTHVDDSPHSLHRDSPHTQLSLQRCTGSSSAPLSSSASSSVPTVSPASSLLARHAETSLTRDLQGRRMQPHMEVLESRGAGQAEGSEGAHHGDLGAWRLHPSSCTTAAMLESSQDGLFVHDNYGSMLAPAGNPPSPLLVTGSNRSTRSSRKAERQPHLHAPAAAASTVSTVPPQNHRGTVAPQNHQGGAPLFEQCIQGQQGQQAVVQGVHAPMHAPMQAPLQAQQAGCCSSPTFEQRQCVQSDEQSSSSMRVQPQCERRVRHAWREDRLYEGSNRGVQQEAQHGQRGRAHKGRHHHKSSGGLPSPAPSIDALPPELSHELMRDVNLIQQTLQRCAAKQQETCAALFQDLHDLPVVAATHGWKGA